MNSSKETADDCWVKNRKNEIDRLQLKHSRRYNLITYSKSLHDKLSEKIDAISIEPKHFNRINARSPCLIIALHTVHLPDISWMDHLGSFPSGTDVIIRMDNSSREKFERETKRYNEGCCYQDKINLVWRKANEISTFMMSIGYVPVTSRSGRSRLFVLFRKS